MAPVEDPRVAATQYAVTARWIEVLHAVGWGPDIALVNAAVREVVWAADSDGTGAALHLLHLLVTDSGRDMLPGVGLLGPVVGFMEELERARRAH